MKSDPEMTFWQRFFWSQQIRTEYLRPRRFPRLRRFIWRLLHPFANRRAKREAAEARLRVLRAAEEAKAAMLKTADEARRFLESLPID